MDECLLMFVVHVEGIQVQDKIHSYQTIRKSVTYVPPFQNKCPRLQQQKPHHKAAEGSFQLLP